MFPEQFWFTAQNNPEQNQEGDRIWQQALGSVDQGAEGRLP
jgi:hypothetical protein